MIQKFHIAVAAYAIFGIGMAISVTWCCMKGATVKPISLMQARPAEPPVPVEPKLTIDGHKCYALYCSTYTNVADCLLCCTAICGKGYAECASHCLGSGGNGNEQRKLIAGMAASARRLQTGKSKDPMRDVTLIEGGQVASDPLIRDICVRLEPDTPGVRVIP